MKKLILSILLLTTVGCTTNSNVQTTCEITQNKVKTLFKISDDSTLIEIKIPNSYMDNLNITKIESSERNIIFQQFIEKQGYVINKDSIINSTQNNEYITIQVKQTNVQFQNSLVQKYDYDKKSSIIKLLEDNSYLCN